MNLHKTLTASTLVLTLGLVGCASEGTTSRTTTAPAGVAPEREQSTTGDYSSIDDYVIEMMDSSNKTADLLEVSSDAVQAMANEQISPTQFGQLMGNAREVVASHIGFFESRQPPPAFAASERLILQAWHIYDRAFEYAETCGYEQDISACERTIQLLQEGTDLADDAAAALPSN